MEETEPTPIYNTDFIINLYAFVILDFQQCASGDFSNIGKSYSFATIRVLELSDDPCEITAVIRHLPDERLDMDVIYHFPKCRYIAPNNKAEFAFLLADVRESERHLKTPLGTLGPKIVQQDDECVPRIKENSLEGLYPDENTLNADPPNAMKRPNFSIIAKVRQVRSQNFSIMWATRDEHDTNNYVQTATIRLGWELPLGTVQPGIIYKIEGIVYSLNRYCGWLATTVISLGEHKLLDSCLRNL